MKQLLKILGIALVLLPEPTIVGSDAVGIILLCLSFALPEKRRKLVSSSGVIIRNGFLPK